MTKKLPSESDLRKFFKEEFDRSGFSFENKVEKVLRKNDFHVKREVPFLDKDELIGRRIDFVAEDGVLVDRMRIHKTSIKMGELRLIVECKSLHNYAWIFFKGKHFGDKPAEEMYFKKPKISDYKYLPKPFIKKLFFASGYTEIVYPLTNNKKRRNFPEKLFEAVAQVTKATRYQIDYEIKLIRKLRRLGASEKEAKSPWDFIILQPLIIFGGNLYKINEDDGKLESIDFVQIDKEWVSKNYEEIYGEIHIVSFNALQKYIDILRDNYDFAHNPRSKTEKIYKEFKEKVVVDIEKKQKRKKWIVDVFKLK